MNRAKNEATPGLQDSHAPAAVVWDIKLDRTAHKGSSNFPYLAFNEHHTLRVLARLNRAPVAHTQLSDDGQVLLVERFDVDARGVATHGLEDACSLLGLPPHEKYAPSMERVLKATEAYLPGATRQAQLEQLAYQLLTNFVVRNSRRRAGPVRGQGRLDPRGGGSPQPRRGQESPPVTACALPFGALTTLARNFVNCAMFWPTLAASSEAIYSVRLSTGMMVQG